METVVKTNSSSALGIVKKYFPKVTSVVDASRNTFIEVTKADASSKAVKNHNACAMAVACKRAFKLDGVIISRSKAYLIKGTRARRFDLPASVIHEIISFDRGAGFSTGKYELSRVAPTNKLGAREKRPKDNAVRDNKSKRFRHITTNARTVLGGKRPEE